MPGNPIEPPRHDRDSEDESQLPTEDIGDVDDELEELDDVDFPDRGVDQ